MDWVAQFGPVFFEYHGRILLPVVALLLIAAGFLTRRTTRRRLRKSLVIALSLTAVLSGLVWHNFFNFHYGTFVNSYEHFHYYLGTKYSDELGYFDLYSAALAVDRSAGGWYRPPDGMIRSLRTNRLVPLRDALDDSPRLRARFSTDRWDEFTRDVVWFRDRLGPQVWNRVLRDHGYNGTPVWTTVVGAITGVVPTGDGMILLAVLDSLLLLLAVVAVWRTFGLWPGLLTAIVLGSSYLMAHVHMKGALLRTDFAVSLVGAACLLRRGNSTAAGVLVGYSTLSRIFPVVFVFGLIAKAIWAVLDRGKGAVIPYAKFGAGFVLSVTALVGFSLIDHGRVGVWNDFRDKLSMHREQPHIWDLGLATIVDATFDSDSTPPTRRSSTRTREGRPLPGPVLSFDAAERRGLLRALIALAGLGLGFAACRRLSDAAALCFGFVPFFLLVSPTYYYYILLLLPLLYFAERLDQPFGLVGTSWIFVMAIAGFVLYARFDQYFPTTYWNAVMAAALAGMMIVDGLRRKPRPL